MADLHAVSTGEQFERGISSGVSGSTMQEARGLAERFYKDGQAAYGEVLYGEQAGKVMYLALLAMGARDGMAGLAIGNPGGGKSFFLEHGHEVVGDITAKDIANVPHRDDLTPAQLVGDTSEMERTGVRDGEPFREEFSSKVKPILHAGIKVIKFDEITRTSPLALNAALKITQDGSIPVFDDEGKIQELSDIDMVVSSTNNYGTLYTHNLDPAMIGRHGMGVFLGHRNQGQLSEAGTALFENIASRHEKPSVKPVIQLQELHTIRKAIDHVEWTDQMREMGKRLTIKMLDSLEDLGIKSADPRPIKQLVRVASTLSMFNVRTAVAEEDIKDAVRYGMTAKLGLGTDHSSEEISKIIDEVVSTS